MPKVTQRKQRLVRSRTYGGFGAPIVSTVTTTTLPTQRKVSEEDMHSSSSSSSSSFESLHQVLKNSTTTAKFNEDGSYRTLPCNSNNNSDMAETTINSRENSFRLMKRPAPSVCLVDLASEESSQQHSTNFTIICPSSPVPSSTTTALKNTTPLRRRAASASEASSPWGHFIDMLMEDQAEYSSGCLGKNTCFLPSCPPSPFRLDRFSHCSNNNNNDPYPRLKPKRQRRRSVSAPLSGFALAFSDMEETANQLSSLTF